MKAKYYIFIIILLCIFNILLIFKFNKVYQDKKNQMNSLTCICKNFKRTIHLNEELIITNLNRENVSFKSTINKKPKLILKYSEINCWSCVENLIKRILKYSKNHKKLKTHMLILSSYKNQNNFVISHKTLDIGIPVYNLRNKSLGFADKDLQRQPFFFVTDSSYLSKMVYIPNLDKPELIDKYLDAVVERFFKESQTIKSPVNR